MITLLEILQLQEAVDSCAIEGIHTTFEEALNALIEKRLKDLEKLK